MTNTCTNIFVFCGGGLPRTNFLREKQWEPNSFVLLDLPKAFSQQFYFEGLSLKLVQIAR